jgi:hypothetical protein
MPIQEIPKASMPPVLLHRDPIQVPARLLWLHNQLQNRSLPAEIFAYRRTGINYFNLYCHLRFETASPRRPILVTAHWDTINATSDNCLDNTASLWNLIELAGKLQQLQVKPGRDIILAWTDAEELQSTYLCGAVEAALAYQPELLLDLELTAGGTHILCQTFGVVSYRGLNPLPIETPMPGNNAQLVWNQQRSGLLNGLRGAACLTMVNDMDLQELRRTRFCGRWGQCHQPGDSFDNWLNPDEMNQFTDWMVDLILAFQG